MRPSATAAEALLWEELRGRLLGVTFRRKFVIDRYIVDFYCAARRLVVEVDRGRR
jgi:leucyl-tRNA synthetase